MRTGFGEQERRLHDRSAQAQGLVVDADGVLLGPDCPLVERTRGGFLAIGLPVAKRLLRDVFAYDDDPRPFVTLCRSIGKALDDGDLLRAQLLGLQMPIGVLGRNHLARLKRFAPMAKAGFDPNQPRAANGEWGEPDTSSSSPNRREISRGVVIRGDGQAAYDRSVEYLGRSPLGAKILAQAEALGVVVNIIAGAPSDGGDKAVLEDDGTVHVNWSPRLGLTNGEAILSPALSLLHEFGHAIALIRDPSGVVVRLRQTMPDYGNAEEFRVISTIENPVAADLGEPIRHTHEPAKGELQTYVTTDDPTFHHGGVWR